MPRESISTAIENNTVEYFLALGRAAHNEVCETPAVTYILNDGGHSRIFKACFSEEEADLRIGRVLERLERRNISALWFITPRSRPESLECRLKERGFTYQREWISMARGLESLPPPDMPAGLVIKEVRSDEGLKTWSEVLVKSFEVDGRISGAFGRYFVDAGIGERQKRSHYMGFLNGEPAATASLFKGTAAAGIYYVGTLRRHRGLGIGRAMTGHLLRKARDAGYGIATLNASQQGYPLYEKMGFKEYYRTKIYQWP